MDNHEIIQDGHQCPGCNDGTLELVKSKNKRYSDHLQCNVCDAIYIRHTPDCLCWICKKKRESSELPENS
jgi:hypothetical protein